MEADRDLERRAFARIAGRLVPLLTVSYILNYLDRSNISFAALTMNQQLGLTATQFGVGAGILFVGYCAFEIPSNIALYRFGARRWIARIMITWGLVSAASALIVGVKSFYLLRFLLGTAEAGFFPGVAFYLSTWFPVEYRTRMLAWFLVGIPASSVVGGPVSGALLGMDGLAGLAGWQWLFILEGLPVSFLGIAMLWVLADGPASATWLSEDERRVVLARIAAEPRHKEVRRLMPALGDIRVLILAGVQLGFTIGSYGVGIWLPQIIKTQPLSNFAIGLVYAGPYALASIGMIAWAAYVDRTGRKIGNLALGCVIAAAGLLLSILFADFWLSFFWLTVALICITSARAIFWTIPPRFLSGIAAAGGLAFINSIGTLGGFLGPSIVGWLKDLTGSFSAGLLAMAAFLLLSTLLALSLKLFVRQE